LISYSIKLLRGEGVAVYVIGILGVVIILFFDYIYRFLFSLICGLIYNAVVNKSAIDNIESKTHKFTGFS